jgi:hypothetical protein
MRDVVTDYHPRRTLKQSTNKPTRGEGRRPVSALLSGRNVSRAPLCRDGANKVRGHRGDTSAHTEHGRNQARPSHNNYT